MDELTRAIEATLFASAIPLTVEEIGQYVGEGPIEIALGEPGQHRSDVVRANMGGDVLGAHRLGGGE